MTRRAFLQRTATAVTTVTLASSVPAAPEPENGNAREQQPKPTTDWLERWRRSILNDARNRYCDKETGEELGWMVSPFLNGFYYGFRATRDAQWLEHLIDWTDSCLKRAVKEPDGFYG